MIAKYNGKCKVTGKQIVAGVTNIEKINGIWQVVNKKQNVILPSGAIVSLAWSDVYQDRYGDEYLKHFASFGDEDGEPIGTIWNCESQESAENLAEELFQTYKLEDCLIETM